MKKLKFLIILTVFLFPLMAQAYGETPYNPIYVKVEPTNGYKIDLQNQQNIMLDATVRANCGTIYNSCYQSMCGGRDTSNPQIKASCLQLVLTCCNNKSAFITPSQPQPAQQQLPVCPNHSTYINGTCQCNVGYIVSNDSCVLPVVPNCTANSTYTNGSCVCNNGYVVKGNECVLPSLDDGCQQNYGIYSYSQGKDDKGINNCGCINGYEWSKDYKFCVKSELVQAVAGGGGYAAPTPRPQVTAPKKAMPKINIVTSTPTTMKINLSSDSSSTIITSTVSPRVVTNGDHVKKIVKNSITSFFKWLFKL